jgi:hypothetical protein
MMNEDELLRSMADYMASRTRMYGHPSTPYVFQLAISSFGSGP